MIATLTQPIHTLMARLEGILAREGSSDIPLAHEVMRRALSSGGKRLRPAILLLTCELLSPLPDRTIPPESERLELAAALELIHTASLLHDDVVDGAALRRGTPSARASFGDAASVLTGDLLWCNASRLILKFQRQGLTDLLLDALVETTRGVLREAAYQHTGLIPEHEAIAIAEGKTAALFTAATEAAALLLDATEQQRHALTVYGHGVGLAFQLADDALDLTSTTEDLGKPVRSDLLSGICTYPMIAAAKRAPEHEAIAISRALTETTLSESAAAEVARIIEHTGGVEATLTLAKEHSNRAGAALELFPESPARTALMAIARYAATRSI